MNLMNEYWHDMYVPNIARMINDRGGLPFGLTALPPAVAWQKIAGIIGHPRFKPGDLVVQSVRTLEAWAAGQPAPPHTSPPHIEGETQRPACRSGRGSGEAHPQPEPKEH
jgi:hypothetical protein